MVSSGGEIHEEREHHGQCHLSIYNLMRERERGTRSQAASVDRERSQKSLSQRLQTSKSKSNEVKKSVMG